jgi:hypothetical protein
MGTATGTAQLLYRNLAAINVWQMLRAMDPGLPAWEELDESAQQRCVNDITDSAMRMWWRQTPGEERH